MSNHKRIAWTLENAAAEFALNPRTLSARLKQSGAKPDADGRWTTVQIATAVYGSLELERIRKTRAEADEVEMRNAETSKRLIGVDDFCKSYEQVIVDCTRIIRESKLTEDDQSKILEKLSEAHKTQA